MSQKHILIQGAARGLGLALVRRLLADQQTVITATARDPQASQALLALRERYGESRLYLQPLDITDEDSLIDARRTIGQRHERLDLMMTCAGLLHDDRGLWPEKRLADIDPANLARSFAVNATGPVLMIKHFHDLMTHGNRAVIASLSARVGSISDNGYGGWYAYRAAKAAQNQFTRTASIELARRSKNLICVGLHPGTVDTGLSEPFQKNVPEGQLQSADRAAGHLLGVIAKLNREHSGRVFDWAGKEIAP